MLKLLINAPTYKIVNDIMWEVIIHCNKNKIPIKKINWANVNIKTKNCNMKFCLEKEFKRIPKRAEYDASFSSKELDKLLLYILEVEKYLKCNLVGRRIFK